MRPIPSILIAEVYYEVKKLSPLQSFHWKNFAGSTFCCRVVNGHQCGAILNQCNSLDGLKWNANEESETVGACTIKGLFVDDQKVLGLFEFRVNFVHDIGKEWSLRGCIRLIEAGKEGLPLGIKSMMGAFKTQMVEVSHFN
jgi:hypothetical protein